MKLLAEISEKSLGVSEAEVLGASFVFRKSVRAVLLDSKNRVCLQFIGKHNYYKLPGGGVESGETEGEALVREVREEVGCELTVQKELGVIIEYRSTHGLLHLSYGYLARVKGEIGRPSYEPDEINEGYKSVWVSLEEAVKLLNEHCQDQPYSTPFIVTREKTFLAEARSLLNSNLDQ